MKYCYKCKMEKDESEFHKNKSKKFGLASQCKNCVKNCNKKYYAENKTKILRQNKNYFQENKTKKLNYNKNYFQENKTKIAEQKRVYENVRYNNDESYKVNQILGRQLSRLLTQNSKSAKLFKYLDCTRDEFFKWISFQFDGNMTWENHNSYWEIDHVLPRSYFNHLIDAEICACWGWRNLRPCLIETNREKRSKVDFDLYYSQILKSIEFLEE